MPSPLGHACAGIATGWLCRGFRDGGDGLERRGLGEERGFERAEPAPARPRWRPTLVFAALGMLPDIDLLFGAHSGPTHGLGAALIVAVVALAVTRSWRWTLAAGLAYASHTLLDWLGTDTKAPIGIMALWPFSHAYYESGLHVFMGVSRQIHASNFWSYNLRALLREMVVLLPILAAVGFLRARWPGRAGGAHGDAEDRG